MKKLKDKIVGIIIVLAIIIYFVVFYPLIVSVDKNGETTCKSIIGLSVGC